MWTIISLALLNFFRNIFKKKGGQKKIPFSHCQIVVRKMREKKRKNWGNYSLLKEVVLFILHFSPLNRDIEHNHHTDKSTRMCFIVHENTSGYTCSDKNWLSMKCAISGSLLWSATYYSSRFKSKENLVFINLNHRRLSNLWFPHKKEKRKPWKSWR